MLGRHNHRRTERRIARLFTVGLKGKATARLFEQLEQCPSCARVYERYHAMESALFGTPEAPSKIAVERVAGSIFSHPLGPPKKKNAPWIKRSVAIAGALAATVLIVLFVHPEPAPHRVALTKADATALEELTPRGIFRPTVSYVGIRVFRVGSKQAGLKETADININDTITFTYTYTKDAKGYLMLLGLQEEAAPLWYYPDYGEETSITITGQRVDEPLGDGITLWVNHKPGPLRIVALFSEAPLGEETILPAVERLDRNGSLFDVTAPLLLDDSAVEAVEYSIVLTIGEMNDGDN